jgi:exodeoxyribonuclease VII small subunit
MEDNAIPEKSVRKRKQAGETAEEQRPFEEVLKELEQVAAQMERGDLPLDDAIASFEKGIRLSAYCRKKLDEAEGKIQKLTREAGLEEFPDAEGGE